jgi:DNA-binding NarL/FixJ family response regulator
MWVIEEENKVLTKRGKIQLFKALIVEDSAIFRKLLKETLHSRFPSMEIFEASEGEEALQIINANPPDLIFMDIRLPGESGLELTSKVKARYPDVVVIIMTSYDTPEYREAAVQAKANYFLSKGSSSKEGILKLVESILAGQ